ncbi:MAG: N-6 DNA methylase [Candidatus Pacebacteria bacterium]|nr:N-6 DNA methylase [Candidatus Paceibacterota bacterium]
MKNKFCEKKVLRNESDVEQFFVARLLNDLGWKDNNILTKHAIPSYEFGKGPKKKYHIPDYQIQFGKTPFLIIEAKHPRENIGKYVSEAQDYAMVVNRGFIGRNPVQFVLATNGTKTKLAKVDESKIILSLDFEDFVINNEKYNDLKKYISFSNLKKSNLSKDDIFEFKTPDLAELKGVFKQAHDLIRRKQKIGPKKAFYEFTKVLFVKMNEDKEIQDKIINKEDVSVNDFRFSVKAIERNGKLDWINILFEEYREILEKLVVRGEKKRIFQKNEKISLTPSTTKAIVEMIENFNLRSVEDDINGKVFETFLSATVRGKDLGQFFTPRSVVKFMTKLVDLHINKDEMTGKYTPDLVLDGSCGTGGFLIFALSDLFNKIPKGVSNKELLKKKIREDSLFGIDASEDDIVPITRMNMYLHGDGGSHIFLADTLDKDLLIEKGLDREIAEEREELKNLFNELKFDVVLTNPPFSMKYEQSKADEKRILGQYEIAMLGGNIAKSLKSNIMFIERYFDLLKPGGKLVTVIDESVLNTEGQGKSMQKFRKWLREKFIIKAIISLPKNTFVNADAGVKTSVVYLTKRMDEKQEQPPVFMAISENIGHNDAGRETSEWGDLGKILKSFKKFQDGTFK